MTANQPSSHDPLITSITASDVLGKDVIDSDGAFLGVTDRLFIDNKTLDITGISVDKGFLKKGLVIGKAYIKEVTDHAVFLNMSPVFRMRGMLVFTHEGEKIGFVKSIILNRNQNKVKSILVQSGTIKKIEYDFPVKLIETVGTNVMLKETENIKKFLSE